VAWYDAGISNISVCLLSFSTIAELTLRRRIRVTFSTTYGDKYHQVYVAYVLTAISSEVGQTTIDLWVRGDHTDVRVIAVDSENRLTDYSSEVFPTTPRRARRPINWPIEGTTPWLSWLNFFANDGSGTVDFDAPINILPMFMLGTYGSSYPPGATREWMSGLFNDGVYSFGAKVLDAAGNPSESTKDYCVFVTAYPDVSESFQVDSYDSTSDLITLSWSP